VKIAQTDPYKAKALLRTKHHCSRSVRAMSVNSSQDDGGESGVSGTFNNIYIFPLGGWEGASLGVADSTVMAGTTLCSRVSGRRTSMSAVRMERSVLLGNSDGTMRSARYLPEGNGTPRPSVAADFNGDGFQDLIFPSGYGAGQNCTPSGFMLLLSDRSGGCQAPPLEFVPRRKTLRQNVLRFPELLITAIALIDGF
jgi:hypothetical protein